MFIQKDTYLFGAVGVISKLFRAHYENRSAPSTDVTIGTVWIIAWFDDCVRTNYNIIVKLPVSVDSRHHEHCIVSKVQQLSVDVCT